MDRPLDALPEGTKLAGYVIGQVLGRGAFGVTYLATEDLFPDRKVAIKEFLPTGIAMRNSGDASVHPNSRDQVEPFRQALASFRREALTLRALSHPNIVDVQRYIEANGTAYMVMRFEEGRSLADLLAGGPLNEAELRALLPPLLDGLAAIHAKNFVHRDLKPANVYVRHDGSPVLIDFGAAREAIGAGRQSSLSEIVTPGYAPLEQYDRHAEQGPYTDIYALGATLYRCMVGRTPPDAITRHNAVRRGLADPLLPALEEVGARYSPAFVAAVRQALTIDEHERPPTIDAMRRLLLDDPTLQAGAHASALLSARTLGVPAPPGSSGPTPRCETPARPEVAKNRAMPPRPRRNRAWLPLVVIAVAAAAGMVLWQPWTGEPAAGRTADVSPGRAPAAAGRVFRDCTACPEMVVVPAGRFTMGSVRDAELAREDETPQRQITIAEPFAIGRFELTFAEWDACVAARGCDEVGDDNGWGRGRMPAINLPWNAAKQYVAWLSRTTGKTYRLPSEAEWEYAARSGSTTHYSWGEEAGSSRANCESCGSRWDGKQPAPVGSFAANRFGLYDMHGNVWELVEDCRNDSYTGAPPDARPWLTGDCVRRIMRGGSWNNHGVIRSAHRESIAATDNSYDIGFRVVRELD